MFLLLAPSALTGKRPGLYCLQGQRSQDAPKGPKREVRGWIVRRQHKRTHTHAHTLLKTKKKVKIASLLPPSPLLSILSHYQEFQEMKSGQCSNSLFHIEHPDQFERSSLCFLFLMCILRISSMDSQHAFSCKTWKSNLSSERRIVVSRKKKSPERDCCTVFIPLHTLTSDGS